MNEAMTTIEGWYCLHDFRTMDWAKWKVATEAERDQALHEFKELLHKWETIEDEHNGSHTVYTIAGNKADLMFMILRPTMKDLIEVKTAFNKTALADFTRPAFSYVSVIEKSSYSGMAANPFENPAMRAKLYPTIPKMDYICFYPMSKLRGEKSNWFMLPKEDRKRLMFEHIDTGKPYSEQVKRIVTGSVGFDDFEWGVSLFCDDALQFKKLIYETRFDEVSAVYGIFGSFFIGNLLETAEVNSFFCM
ncbi:heme-dependent peroxidase [Neobacillus sp. MM2021_6]|uniref:hydrogen peroxide-dependent heme synthase n=1 Tax=Bacillaceae TaxID=186817 RepID=UPI00140E53BA|nr:MULTISPECIES: hydrogen peroxide-dependent heme synthase [Bacillaceae]MBO0960267.1 heme-dependent peroxidase [Neobacillus sp. MM2021_6]NHC19397.1 heme-dependent peroxidase [Bacillus sp. MM2020_4]